MTRSKVKASMTAALGLSVLALATAAQAAPSIVSNGSFENGLTSWTTSGFVSQNYDYGIDGNAQDGANAFYGGAVASVGYLQQALGTVAGQNYAIDFWLASDGFLPNQFQLVAGNNVLLDVQDILTQPYGAFHAVFLATGTSTSLAFGFRNDSGYLHLDNVSVSAIPEPATDLLLALGLGALLVYGRRSSAKTTATGRGDWRLGGRKA